MSQPKTCHRRNIHVAIALLSVASITEAEEPKYSPYADRAYPENVYWGDTHVHTSRSPDAYTLMNRLDPEVAYRFAKGETVVSQTGLRLRIGRPLDFLVVSDHAMFMGVFSALDSADPLLLDTEVGKRWYALSQQGMMDKVLADLTEIFHGDGSFTMDRSFKKAMWDDVIADAEKHNDPGKFTAFIGYEWTSTVGGDNLHRNIIFRDACSRAEQVVPFSSVDATDSPDPEGLWRWMEDYEQTTGGRVLAIPHNGNMSNGLMFADKTFSGEDLTRQYAETRSRWEPLYEVTQIKGDGETHPYLSPDDGFADFETWDFGNMGIPVGEKSESMLKHEYARSALKLGLEFEAKLGVNPFKFGMIGSTDAHTSFAGANENNFFGKMSADEPDETGRFNQPTGLSFIPRVARYVASGYAAVWAMENTRESLFDAMQRKETYATSGPRIVLRFFGGWDFEQGDELRPDYVDTGYRKGVPMGGNLINPPNGQSPAFIIVASKDPDGANLDRIQVVKGWLDDNGETHEKVYNVAVSDGRRIGRNGKVKPLKHTVDLESATYFNSIGDPTLATPWTDPDFDPGQRAFYYVRVLEIPTPRWTTYDAAFFNESRPEDVPAIIQERAYSSPIWYTP